MADDTNSRDGDRVPRRSSDERRTLHNVFLAYQQTAGDLRRLAEDFDRLSGDARRARCFDVAVILGKLGDKAHETRIAMREFGSREG